MSYGDFWWHLRHAVESLRLSRWWPWMTKKRHNAILRQTQDHLNRLRTEDADNNERGFAAIRDRVYLLHLDVVRRSRTQQFTLTCQFSEDLLRYGTDHREWAPYVAARMTSEVSRALAQLDFSRMKPWPPERQPRDGAAYGMDLSTAAAADDARGRG